MISGDWKLVRFENKTPWELFNLSDDPFETGDLSSAQPEKAADLGNKWNTWAMQNLVFALEE